MDLEPSDDELALQQGMRSFVQGRFGREAVRGVEDAGRLDRDRWRELGGTGVFSLRLAEQDGGAGLGAVEAALAFEELGRGLVPGPLVPTHLAAGLVDGAASGETIVGLVAAATTPVIAEHLADLDVLVVLDDARVLALDPASLDAGALARPLDALTPVHVVPAPLPPGSEIGGPVVATRWRLEGAVLTAALQVGLALACVDLATAHAKEREQFGRPIGSFQAVKHLCADMLVRAEVARAAVHAGACALDGRSDDPPARAAAVAKAMAGDAALFCGKTCIQVHGGMGFTWEVDAQRYWKRACVLDTHFGDGDHHAAAVAATL